MVFHFTGIKRAHLEMISINEPDPRSFTRSDFVAVNARPLGGSSDLTHDYIMGKEVDTGGKTISTSLPPWLTRRERNC